MKRTLVKLDRSRFPGEVRPYLEGPLFDSSCSEAAKVLFCAAGGGVFLKEAPKGSLENEARMTAFYHSLGLSAKVLYYGSHDDKDYLITRAIPGEDCIDPAYLSDPERLCDTIATYLRALHETDFAGCPIPDRNRTYVETVRAGIAKGCFEADLFEGIWEFASFEEAKTAALEGFSSLSGRVLLHGDYCLPNIILSDWKLSGFIDLGSGGVGDRHIDVLWGIWTLKLNLGTAAYSQRFIDAYGRELIDIDKLRSLAAMEITSGV